MGKVNNFIEQYVEATSFTTAPTIFRKWTALSVISTATQRKIFCDLHGRALFPNLYIILVGPPGVGKGRAITEGRERLNRLTTLRVSPAMLSAQKFFHNVGEATRAETGSLELIASYAILTDELSSFLTPAGKDPTLINLLTDFFDCPSKRSYETLSRKAAQAEQLFITMLCGTTPKSIAEIFGKSTSGLGFVSRTNFIFSEDFSPLDLFADKKAPNWKPIDDSLFKISKMSGEIKFDPVAKNEVQAWIDGGMLPKLSEPRLEEYNARRAMHFIKLCMLYAIARHSMEITYADVGKAKDTLLEAEGVMLGSFSYMGGNPFLEAFQHTASWLRNEYLTHNKPISETALKRRFLMEIPPQYLKTAITEFVDSGFAKFQGEGANRGYYPSKT